MTAAKGNAAAQNDNISMVRNTYLFTPSSFTPTPQAFLHQTFSSPAHAIVGVASHRFHRIRHWRESRPHRARAIQEQLRLRWHRRRRKCGPVVPASELHSQRDSNLAAPLRESLPT